MKGTNKRSGISLIVLVITIIVIIILAVAVILTLSNNNPIENAKKAVSANDEATLKEEATLLYADWYMKKNLDGEDVGDADKYVKDNLQGDYGDLLDRLIVSDSGVITISEPLEIVEGVTIPRGFEHVAGTTVATGLVIKNTTDNNEFVWVPVEEGTFVRESFKDTELDTTTYVEPYSITDYTEEVTEYNAMVSSVNAYGGFYIARYEASNNGSGVAQSKADETPWKEIVWGDSMTEIGTTGAVAKARAVYPASSATKGDAVSILPYGVQWDATVRFLETNYPGIAEDSTGYGNYSTADEDGYSNEDADIINTGSNPAYALNNIFDIAGNLYEWTMEAYSSSDRVPRGGCYYYTGSGNPVSRRSNYDPIGRNDDVGFRLALYIK